VSPTPSSSNFRGLLGKRFNMTNISTDDNGTRPSTPRLLSIRDVADILGVSPRTVQRLISSRKLPAYRIGGLRRIAPNDVKKFLREHRECGREKNDDENDESD
jgi:excisionase family DNA binding protein